MEYSKITSVELINFMSFDKAKVTFDERGIINLKGFNDSGKSAILRAMAVCLMDKYRSKQAKFIRHGEEGFRVVVSFDDGVSIIRDKYINGQSLYEVYKDGNCIYTTKQGNKLSRVDGVPQPIQDYLGLCVTNSVYLNYQSNEDKLPVVDSTGSENYQMFHEVLRMEEIFRANNMINTDKNQLGSEITEIEADLQRDEVLLERCGDVTEEFIETIQKLELEAEETNKRKSKLGNTSEIISNMDAIRDIPSISRVSTDRLETLNSIGTVVVSLDRIQELPSIPKVSTDKLDSLRGIAVAVRALDGYVNVPSIPKVDKMLVESRVELGKIISIYNKLCEVSAVCSKTNIEIKSAREQLNGLVESAREQGYELVKCRNCGTYTLAGGGHSHE